MSKGVQYKIPYRDEDNRLVIDTRIPTNIRNPFMRRLTRADLSSHQDVVNEMSAWVEAENTRWAIVGKCSICDEELIAEEQLDHRINHLSSHARVIVRQMLNSPRLAEILKAVKLFDEAGEYFDNIKV